MHPFRGWNAEIKNKVCTIRTISLSICYTFFSNHNRYSRPLTFLFFSPISSRVIPFWLYSRTSILSQRNLTIPIWHFHPYITSISNENTSNSSQVSLFLDQKSTLWNCFQQQQTIAHQLHISSQCQWTIIHNKFKTKAKHLTTKIQLKMKVFICRGIKPLYAGSSE